MTTARDEIVLIGPPKSGKTTIGRLLSSRLELPLVSLDESLWDAFAQGGYDLSRDRGAMAEGGFEAVYRYRKPFEARAVCDLLAAHRGCIFDLTSSAVVQEDPALFAKVRDALSAFRNVFVLMPEKGVDEAIAELRARTSVRAEGFDFVAHCVRHASYRELGTQIVHTSGRLPRQTADEIVVRAGPAGHAIAAEREPDEDIDRTFIDQYVALQRQRLPSASDYLQTLQACQANRLAQLMGNLRTKLAQPLPDASRAFVNACFAEIDEATKPILAEARIPDEARARAQRMYGYRLMRGATLGDVLRVDPFDGLAPFLDSAALEDLLLEPDRVRPSVKTLQRSALHHRFLHRPQRTAYLFFHESVVGYLLNVFENRGVVRPRKDLQVTSPTYSEVPAFFIDALAKSLKRRLSDVVALHFVDRKTIEDAFPAAIKDLFLVADHIYTYMELLMLYIRGSVGRRINADLHLFFTIHSLERIVADPTLALVPDAGRIIDDLFCRYIYGYEEDGATRESNEADVIKILCGFVETLWKPGGRA